MLKSVWHVNVPVLGQFLRILLSTKPTMSPSVVANAVLRGNSATPSTNLEFLLCFMFSFPIPRSRRLQFSPLGSMEHRQVSLQGSDPRGGLCRNLNCVFE